MKNILLFTAVFAIAVISAVTMAAGSSAERGAAPQDPTAAAHPALSVSATTPRMATLPVRVTANGNIVAWQEASVGAEANGLRLSAVNVTVGDAVRRGQVLAIFSPDTVAAELAQSRAAVAEAAAAASEAGDNARRARQLEATGALSAQQILQHLTAEHTARARLEAAQAAEQMQQLRLKQTQVLAPDDGVISSRTATLGAVLPAGQELFRLVRRGRLEWHAEVAAHDLSKLQPGQVVHVTPNGSPAIRGRLQRVAPTIDTRTRNGLAYVQLPLDGAARAGDFARGEIEVDMVSVMTLPQSAVLLRDGLHHVMRIGPDQRIVQTRVTVGQRAGGVVEITGGIDTSTPVVASGGAFLGDGDFVRIVDDGRGSNATSVPQRTGGAN